MQQYAQIIVIGVALSVFAIGARARADGPTFCGCVPAPFCPNHGEGSIRPRDDNRTKAGCPEGQRYCCIKAHAKPPTTAAPLLPECGIQNKSGWVPGFSREPRDLANFGEFPWLVRILGPNGKFLGSGALIGESTVLTVAHIFENSYPDSVVLGEWNDAVDVKPYESLTISVKKNGLKKHEDFDSVNLRNDIAVIRLSSPVDLILDNPNIGTACLPHHNFEDDSCFLSTYGDDDIPIVRKIQLPIIPSEKCERIFRSTILGSGFILDPKSFICAGGERGKDACKGHGGAPLVCKGKKHFQLVGLVSWGLTGDDCERKGKLPGVYVNVYSYYKWIKRYLD